MSRVCPTCAARLSAFQFRGVQLDACVQCGGIWFDRGELKQVMRTSESALFALEERVRPKTIGPANRATGLCPECRCEMNSWQVAVEGSARFDRCELCGGLWADDGQLGAFAEWLGNQLDLNDILPLDASVPFQPAGQGPVDSAVTRQMFAALSLLYWLDTIGRA